jgi:hypothetical protein
VQIDDRLIRVLGLNSLSIEIAARRKAESELETLKAQIAAAQAVLGTSETGETSQPDTGQPQSHYIMVRWTGLSRHGNALS